MATAELSTEKLELIDFRKTESEIRKLESEYMGLTVASVNDKAGLAKVHAARMVVKNLRVSIEKKRKELKADALEYGRKVDEIAKIHTALIEPIESHLEEQEAIVKREREQIEREAAEARRKIIDQRTEAFTAVGKWVSPPIIAAMNEAQFTEAYEDAKREKAERDAKAEAERLAREAEAERLRIEAERLAEERRKLEAEQAAKRAEQEKIDAENRRIAEEQRKAQEAIEAEQRKIEAEKQAAKRAEELAKAREEAAERARQEMQLRLEREAEAERIAKEKAELERHRIEAERPERDKVLAFAEQLRALQIPQVRSDWKKAIEKAIETAVGAIEKVAK